MATEAPTGVRGIPLLDRLSALPPALLLGASALVYLLCSLSEMVGDSPTFDEVAHLPAGFTYVTQKDYRLNPEHPPLGKILAALPLTLFHLSLPVDATLWNVAGQYHFGYRFLYQSGNDPDRLLFWGRVPTLGWGLLLIFSVYAVSRELYGPRGALVSLVLATFSPTLIAHGHLVTTDVVVTALFFLTVVAFRELFRKPTLARSIACGILLGGSLGAKYSAVMLLPIVAWLGVVSWLRGRSRRREPDAVPPGPAAPRSRGILLGLACLFLIGFFSMTTLWGLYSFRFKPTPDGSLEYSWNFDGSSLTMRAVQFARTHELLPDAFLNGYAFVHDSTQARRAYALGQYSDRGWWWYFPFAFLVKTPVAALVLMGWGMGALVRRHRKSDGAEDFVIIPLIIYWVLAMVSHINIGLRHVLPVFPMMMVLAGGIPLDGVSDRARTWKGRAAGLLAGAVAVECLIAAPHFLAYFNVPSCVLWERHEMLVDSNLDWGQDLGRLRRFMERRGIADLKLAYFGSASPRQLELRHQILPGANLYPYHEKEWTYAKDCQAGDYVAISATCLVGVLSNDREEYLRRLRTLKPVAEIGHSIRVYQLPQGFRWNP